MVHAVSSILHVSLRFAFSGQISEKKQEKYKIIRHSHKSDHNRISISKSVVSSRVILMFMPLQGRAKSHDCRHLGCLLPIQNIVEPLVIY